MADLGEFFDATSIPNFGPEFDRLPDLPALAELKGYKQWVGWTWTRRQTADGWRWTKPPVNPTNGRSANVASQTTWASYDRAAKAVEERELAGVGFVLTERDPYIGIDLDKCRDPATGEIDAWALEVLAFAETYAEVSPSETGIRLIARGGIEKASKCDPAGVEIYDRGRYVTITGRHVLGSPDEIRGAPNTLAALAARIATFRPEPTSPTKPTAPASERKTGSGRDFFRRVNDLALANLAPWVTDLFPGAQGSPRGYRITSKMLGRNLQEDLSITPEGAVDFGIHDMGDARDGKRTPIDLVIEYGGAPNATDAALWLCDKLNRDPADLGWEDQDELARLGAEIAEAIEEARASSQPPAPAAVSAWPEVTLASLENGRRAPPAFDLSSLGEGLARWAADTARCTSAPADYVATALLTLAGGVLGNARWPEARSGWSEPPILWTALVGDPSAGKSPAMSRVTALADEIEAELARRHEAAMKEYAQASVIAKITHDQWETQVKLAIKNTPHLPPVHMPAEAEEPVKPLRGQLVIGDATTEKLAYLAAGNPQGMLMTRDELAGWLSSLGRYGGGDTDRAFYLECYGGRAFNLNRVKLDAPLYIRHLTIGALGSIQPERLAPILDSAEDGLSARFLWCWPEPPRTFRIHDTRPSDALPRKVVNLLHHLAMTTDALGNPEPVRVPLDAGANDTLESFGQSILERSRDASGSFASALGKARGHALRLSCILEHIRWAALPGRNAEPAAISERAMRAAITMMEGYFLPMAERVFGDAIIPAADKDAVRLARWLRRERINQFNAREVRNRLGGSLRKAEAMDAACEVLVDANVLRPVVRAAGAKGRAPKQFAVNPHLIE
ncbi:MAG: DUF3987 domain-containing protein [Pseudomonadota bacterium]